MHSELREFLQGSLGDDYHLDRELGGGGGAAAVFVAREARLGRDVVVKLLARDLAAAIDVERFRREIQIAAGLFHPNIVPVLGAGSRDDLLYYTMPLVAGRSLREVLVRERQMPLAHALRIAADVAEALAVAHRQEVVHRDIKPDNILLVPDEEAGGWHGLVTDFGIARAIQHAATLPDALTGTGLALGTPLYMSPEQGAADPQLDGRSDIYSLGCVLYEMLAGEPPFSGPSTQAIIARHVNEPPRSVRVVRPDLPCEVDWLLARMLAKAPADRFPDATQLLRALHDPATVVAPRGTPRSIADSGRRPVVRLAFGGVPILGAALAALGAWWLRDASPRVEAPTPDPSRLAVLYLDAPAGDERLSHVGRGIARDLIDALSDVPALTVISDLEVRHVTSPAMNVDSIVRALGVGTIVHGSLEPQGDSLRVLLRVSDASGTLRAAIPLLVQQGQVAGLHDEIASRVASALRRLVGAGVAARTWRAATRSDSAWLLRQRAAERYQAGRDALISGAARTGMLMIEQADTMLALAAALDRAWSDPIVARGWIAAHRAVGQDSATQARWLTAGIQFADEALTRSPGSAPARELRGVQRYRLWRHVRHGRDAPLLALALADLRAATLADPRRARAWTTMGQILNDRGDAQGAAAAARAAMDADPYLVDVAPSVQLLVFSHLQAQRYDSARTLCLDGVRRFPSAPELRACELSVLGWAGRGRADATRAWTLLAREEAALGGPEGPALFPAGRAFAAAVLARSGLTDSAHAVLGATRARLGRDSVGPRWLVYEAMVRTALGERAPALTLLERAVASDVGLRPSIASLPWFVTLRGERRFIALTEPSFSP